MLANVWRLDYELLNETEDLKGIMRGGGIEVLG